MHVGLTVELHESIQIDFLIKIEFEIIFGYQNALRKTFEHPMTKTVWQLSPADADGKNNWLHDLARAYCIKEDSGSFM